MARRVAKTSRQMRGFLNKDLKLTQAKTVDILVKLSLDSFNELLRRTPFDTGFAASSWRVGINYADDTILKPVKGQTYLPPSLAIPFISFGDSVSLYNNCVYIGRLEDGYSAQEPAGMVEPTYQKALLAAMQLTVALSKNRLG